MVANLGGREPGSSETFAVGSNMTDYTGLCVVVSCVIDAS
jgi:hypothetical protein